VTAARRSGTLALRLRLAGPAQNDIEDVLAWSELNFGVTARRRYEALMARALRDLANDPARIGVRQRPELGSGVFSYHLFHSRRRTSTHKVQSSRHLLLARMGEAGFIDILRVLHDAMELSRHLPLPGNEDADIQTAKRRA
jgi:toxin ParE1/3/4